MLHGVILKVCSHFGQSNNLFSLEAIVTSQGRFSLSALQYFARVDAAKLLGKQISQSFEPQTFREDVQQCGHQ
jgi:hypothetical protein